MIQRARGSALLLVTVLLVVFIGLAAAYMAITSHNHFAAMRDHDAEIAFALAEAGIDDAVNELNAGIDYGGDGLGRVAGPLGRGSYEVSIAPAHAGPGRYTLHATGECGAASRAIVAVVAPEGLPADRFSAALFGDALVNIHVNAAVDSWDSRDGEYSLKRVNRFRNQPYAGAKAQVKSNHAVRLGANAKVFGDVTTGPDGGAQLFGSAHVSGSTTRAVAGEKLPPVDVPDVASSGSRTVPAGRSLVLRGGTVRYEWFVLEGGATVKIVGPATVVFDHFTAGPDARIEIDGRAGTVTIYGRGMFRLDPTARWESATKNASELNLRIATDTQKTPQYAVKIDGSGKFYGTIYAPGASLKLDSGMEVFGAVSARAIELGPAFQVHYDEAIAPPPAAPVYRVVSWQEEPGKKKAK